MNTFTDHDKVIIEQIVVQAGDAFTTTGMELLSALATGEMVPIKAERLAELERFEQALLSLHAVIDPEAGTWAESEVDLVAEAVISCWNACADAGLTVRMLDSGIIKQAMQALVDDAHEQAIAYIVRDKDGKHWDCQISVYLEGRSRDMIRRAWLPEALDDAAYYAARIGGTVSAIVTDGVDTWEDDAPE